MSADTTATTGTSPQPEWSLGLDSRPNRAVVGGSVAFVSTSGGAKFPPQLYAVDVDTGELIGHRSAAGQPYAMLVDADGRLWAAGDRHSDQPVGGGINVYDGATLNPAGHADVEGIPLSLAAVGDTVWAGAADAIFVLDPQTLEVVRTLPVAGSVTQLVPLPGGSGVAATITTDVGQSLALLGQDGVALRRVEVPAAGSIVVAVTPTAVWARVPVDTDSDVVRYALPDLVAAPTTFRSDSAGGGIVATAAGDVLVVDDRSDEWTCVTVDGTALPGHPSTELLGVLAALPEDRALFATAAGITAREAACS